MSFECPKCGGEMEKVVFDDIEVDRCDGCGGIWFDLGEEAKLRRLDGSESIDDGDPIIGRLYNSATRIDCPRDGEPMRSLNDPQQRHLQYEVCPACLGAFFDAGEFTDFKETGANLSRLLENIWR